jgi:threonine dehydrogenase-like Zn-dependent dehydrogenase
MQLQDKEFPKLVDPKGRTIEHGVILKLVASDICASDLHIYNGRFQASAGMQMGHENTGEVVEVGSHVQHLKEGDLCSVPFNVACGTCRNCKEGHTDVCLNANEELGYGGAYGFNLGGWQGNQAEYMVVPWADFQLLGASCIIVADSNQARLELVRKAGYEVVDTSSETPVPDQVEQILAYKLFHEGSPKKFVIDPHGSLKTA